MRHEREFRAAELTSAPAQPRTQLDLAAATRVSAECMCVTAAGRVVGGRRSPNAACGANSRYAGRCSSHSCGPAAHHTAHIAGDQSKTDLNKQTNTRESAPRT